MANYVKQTWASGDIVTAAKLNHVEDGIAGANNTMLIHLSYEPGSVDESPTFALEEELQDVVDYLQNSTQEEGKVVIATPSSSTTDVYFCFFSIPVIPTLGTNPETGEAEIRGYTGTGIAEFNSGSGQEEHRIVTIIITFADGSPYFYVAVSNKLAFQQA